MIPILSLQQSGQMSGHMTSSNGSQDTVLIVTLILGLIIIVLLVAIMILLYLFYTGRLRFSKTKSEDPFENVEMNSEKADQDPYQDYSQNEIDLPPVSLIPLEKKILEVVISGHNVLQSDLPDLVKSSKSKVSEALTKLEEKHLIQRTKSGRSLTVTYIYKPTN